MQLHLSAALFANKTAGGILVKRIKTRNSVKNIKILDKPANLSKRMKDAYIRTKESAEETQSSHHESPSDYAGENVQSAAQTVGHILPNPQRKARENFERAKGHFEEVKTHMPKERKQAAEQAQKAAHKAKTNAENLRKTADKAETAAHEAKKVLAETRQASRETISEIKQSAKVEKMFNSATGKQADTAVSKFGNSSSSPGYLDKSVSAPKVAGDNAKAMQPIGKAAKSSEKKFKETAKGAIKTAKRSVKIADRTAKVAQKNAQAAAKTAKAAERVAKTSDKASVKAAKGVVQAVISTVEISIAAVKGLVAAVVAGGWVVLLIVIIICMIGMLAGSAFGIFFSDEKNIAENEVSIKAAVLQINAEFSYELTRIISENPHDDYDIVINRAEWQEVLAVYAVKTSTDSENPLEVATLDVQKMELLRAVFWDMHDIDYWIEEIEYTNTSTDEEGNTATETWYEHILHIVVTSETAPRMADRYRFDSEQKEMLAELLKPEYSDLWAAVLSGTSLGGGVGAIDGGIYIWPSNDSYNITSYFGTRIHPIDGDVDHHNGIDIGAGFGTDVLAAADGSVVLSGWNGEYGNCVIIDHDNGNRTLYAHMSGCNVVVGQTVTQGQTVGFVGSTGTSTGAHIHFETIVNGSRVDPLLFFEMG